MGTPATADAAVGVPRQPQDGKREFSFLDSFLANKKGREKQTGEILNQKRILQQKKDAKPAE